MSKAFISEVDRSIDYMTYPNNQTTTTWTSTTPTSQSPSTIAAERVRLSDIQVEEGIGLPVLAMQQLPKLLLAETIKNQFGAQADALIERLADVKFSTVEDPSSYVPYIGCCISFDLDDGFSFSVLRKIRLSSWAIGEQQSLAAWASVTTFTAADKLKILAGVLGE